MILTPLQYLTGIFNVIISISGIIIGLLVALKYRKTKHNIFLYFGFALFGTVKSWYASAISFIMIIITGKGLSETLYFFIAQAFGTVFVLLWLFAVTELICKDKQKIIIITFAIIGGIFEVYIIYFIFTNPSVIGELKGPMDATYFGVAMIYILIKLLIVVITWILLIHNSLKSKKPDSKLKAWFLAISVISYTTGAICDGIMTLDLITLPIIKTIVILAAIELYIGLILPEPVKRLFSKESNTN